MSAIRFAHRPLVPMDREERVRRRTWHAALKSAQRAVGTDTTRHKRFGISVADGATASRLVKEAVERGRIGPCGPNAARSRRKDLPLGAARGRGS